MGIAESTGVRQVALSDERTVEHGGHRYPAVGVSEGHNIQFGWAFYDKRNIRAKVAQGIALFRERFGVEPTSIQCSVSAATELGEHFEGVKVSGHRYRKDYELYFGRVK